MHHFSGERIRIPYVFAFAFIHPHPSHVIPSPAYHPYIILNLETRLNTDSRLSLLGIYLQRSTVLLMETAIPLTLIYVFSKSLLLLLRESEEIATAAAIFVYGLIPQIYAYAANFPIQKFLQAQSIVMPSAFISFCTIFVHLLLSWLAIYKLGRGIFGAAFVLSLSWWIVVIAQFVYILKTPKCKHTWTGFSLQAFSGLPSFLKLSIASAIMLCLETWYLQILVLLAGLLENPEIALDSLSICRLQRSSKC